MQPMWSFFHQNQYLMVAKRNGKPSWFMVAMTKNIPYVLQYIVQLKGLWIKWARLWISTHELIPWLMNHSFKQSGICNIQSNGYPKCWQIEPFPTKGQCHLNHSKSLSIYEMRLDFLRLICNSNANANWLYVHPLCKILRWGLKKLFVKTFVNYS